jgi:hypothetical protein
VDKIGDDLHFQNYQQEYRVSIILPTGEELICKAEVISDTSKREKEGIVPFNSNLTGLL